ncbi:unnamed protein product [Rotaria sordida]|nr:unnamed protein product [Rotaria sordida]CAF1250205.1 unnamed protein product [Rotaria sordida]CAF3988197.1 unnamed protein product [Rotaria sordida]
MSLLSKRNCQSYYKQFIMPNINRIIYLHLWNPFIIGIVCESLNNIWKFNRLETLILDNIHSLNLLDHLASLWNLSSLIINEVEVLKNDYIPYSSIFRIRTLKYCKILCETGYFTPLAIASNKTSPIEHLVIDQMTGLKQLTHLLSYVPHLRRLSINHLHGFDHRAITVFPKMLNKLTHVSLKLEYITFDEFEPIIKNFFHYLQVLRISTSVDIAYLNANRWQKLILSDMIHLRIFDIEHSYYFKDHNNQTIFSSLIKQFTSSFWIERGWYFVNQHSSRDGLNCGIFYSIQSRRKRDYILSSEKDQNNHSNHVTSDFYLVHHVHIQNQSAMDNCSICFSNADELTISIEEYMPCNSTIAILNRIVSLEKLNKIIINGEHFPFDIVVKILCFTPNYSKLILHSLLLNEIDRTSLKNDSTFRMTSNKNKITNLTVKSMCTLEEVKLFVELCPRLQHLSMKILQEDFISTIKFLLSKHNNDTRDLLTLRIQNTGNIWFARVLILLKSLELSGKIMGDHDYFLWW